MVNEYFETMNSNQGTSQALGKMRERRVTCGEAGRTLSHRERIFRVLAFIKHLVGERFSFTDLHRPVTQRGQTHFTIIQGTLTTP